MTATERKELRNIQDRFLALPHVRYQIDRYGEDEHLAASFHDSGRWPTFRDVRQMLFPDLKGWFMDFFREDV